MRKLALLMCFFIVITYMFNISLFAEDTTASRKLPADKQGGVSDREEPVVDTSGDTKDAVQEEEHKTAQEDAEFVDIAIEATAVKDSFPSFNKAMFNFNDKLYFHFIRPVSNGYKAVVPEVARLGVRNFFTNLKMPIRFFNCLFQGKFKGAGQEGLRLVINSTIGGAGFTDPAKKYFHLDIQDEDFGQTLGRYDIGTGSFLEIPFMGPSNVRDAVGLVGDLALNPLTVISFFVTPFATTGAGIYNELNEISIDKGDTYEGLVEQAIDPYIAVQDAYMQNRAKKVKE